MSHPNAVISAVVVMAVGFALTHYTAALTPLGAACIRLSSLAVALAILGNAFFR